MKAKLLAESLKTYQRISYPGMKKAIPLTSVIINGINEGNKPSQIQGILAALLIVSIKNLSVRKFLKTL